MGQADVNVNLWLKDTKRFADLFDAILFHGETVILPENLHPSPETTAVSLQDAQGKNVVKKQYRDIIMNWQDQALLMLLAVVTKVIGCGLGAKIMRYTNKESLQIGIGMISRGEVALIVANKGATVGLMSEKFMTPLVIMVVFTTIVTPILLKLVFPKKKSGEKETVSDDLTALEKSGINTGLEES